MQVYSVEILSQPLVTDENATKVLTLTTDQCLKVGMTNEALTLFSWFLIRVANPREKTKLKKKRTNNTPSPP